jgi:hypothetical protein
MALLICGLGLATAISSCDTDISINFSTFTSLSGNYSAFTTGKVTGPNGGSMTLTSNNASITCPSCYVIPVSNVKPAKGNSSLVTCRNAGGCDQIAFAALTGRHLLQMLLLLYKMIPVVWQIISRVLLGWIAFLTINCHTGHNL